MSTATTEEWRNHCYRELQTKKRELQNAAKKFGAVTNSRNSKRGDVVGLAIALEDAAHALVRAEKNFVEADQALQALVAPKSTLCQADAS